MPSKGFQKQEEKYHDGEVALASAEIADKTVIFWSRASRLTIGNFVEAVYSGGRLITPEQGLKFYGNVLTTEDPKRIEFIRKSNAFECGDCREVASMEEARNLTAQQNALKGIKPTQVVDVTSTEITLT